MGVEEHSPCPHIQTQMREMIPTAQTGQGKPDAEIVRLKPKQEWSTQCEGSKQHKKISKNTNLLPGKERPNFSLKVSETRHHFEQSP